MGLRRWLWKYDTLPLPNDGKCPWCGHEHGPRFGRFNCDECDGFISDNDMGRKYLKQTPLQFWGMVLGGILFGGALILLMLGIDKILGL